MMMFNAKRHMALLLSLLLTLSLCLSGTVLAEEGATYAADVIVVGAGGAGMSAAVEAAKAGASVIVLEKSAAVGGNTLPAQSGINAAETTVQEALGFVGSKESFLEGQTNELANPELTRFMVENSASAVAWLESIGMAFTVQEKNPLMHKSADGQPIGTALVDALYGEVSANETPILFQTTATSLLVEDGKVVGVLAADTQGNELTIQANAVVLATGGYAQNSALVYAHAPQLTGAITDEIAPTTGDGMLMAQSVGAALVDLGQFTTFPTVERSSHAMLFPNLMRNDVIYIGGEGSRFVNEQWGQADTLAAVMAQDITYAVFDQTLMDSASGLAAFYDRGLVKKGDTVEALAGEMGVDAANMTSAIDQWNADFASGVDSVYGRDSGMNNDLSHAPYYAIAFGVGVHYCMGGIVINDKTEVLREDAGVITGLYAAGETTGGVHGNARQDGSAITDTVVFGRQAGEQAARYALSQGTVTRVVPVKEADAAIEGVGTYTDGTFEGTGVGRNGAVNVQVTVENGNITGVAVMSHEETQSIFMGVETSLIPAIISAQSADVDAVAGATLSSDAVLDAVRMALGL